MSQAATPPNSRMPYSAATSRGAVLQTIANCSATFTIAPTLRLAAPRHQPLQKLAALHHWSPQRRVCHIVGRRGSHH
jgi:hypothetical protein